MKRFFEAILLALLLVVAAPAAFADTDRAGEIRSALESTVHAHIDGRDVDFTLHFPKRQMMHVPGTLRLQVQPFDVAPGLQTLRCRVMIEGRSAMTLRVPCRFTFFSRQPVATRPLKRGSIVTAADYEWRREPVTRNNVEMIEHDGELIEKRVQRYVAEGRVIVPRAVQDPPVVNKGDRVDLVMHRNHLRVTARAVAYQDGWRGSRIRVKNLATKRMVSARVVDKGVVSHD